jgi:hypothetical protein
MEPEVLTMVNLKIKISSCPLNMEAEDSSEMLIATYQTAGCHTPEDCDPVMAEIGWAHC